MEKDLRKQLASLIFGSEIKPVAEIIKLYPRRELKEGQMVTRFAPSPTGFLHIGGVYTALISERLAHQTDGKYYIRIEDTDGKRKIEGAVDIIQEGLKYFNLSPDEGLDKGGDYQPYTQSERKGIYQAFLKMMIEENLAYPCFATTEELSQMREEQSRKHLRPGYYGEWAKWRDAEISVVIEKIKAGEEFVIRFRSEGDPEKRVVFGDLIKGKIEMPENDNDIVIMKSDGLPTYHFAHIIDDYLMGTTHVIRADEWLPSTPLHLQMLASLGFPKFKYGHLAPITKLSEDGGKRKISKRKDPEANIEYYMEKGYPKLAVIEYLMNLASSGFEDWRKSHKDKDYREYRLTFKSLAGSSGPLFDEVKLRDISKDVVSRMDAKECYKLSSKWAEKYDVEFFKKLEKEPEYWTQVLNIERASGRRKDIAIFSEVYKVNQYFDKENFKVGSFTKLNTVLEKNEVAKIRDRLISELDNLEKNEDFMNLMREIAKELGLTLSIKELKGNEDKFRGHVGLVSQVVRYIITGRENTPDLFEIIITLGKEEVRRRLNEFNTEA